MKSTALLLMVCIAMISCNTLTQKGTSDLLTSTKWTVEQKQLLNGEMLTTLENYSFQKDGKYIFESGEAKVTGQWKWTGMDEIYLELKSITLKGVQQDFDNKQNYFIRILEVSEDKLRTLERFNGDSWDSGFAKEKTYIRS